MSTSSKEYTLCAWCGKRLDKRGAVAMASEKKFNGELICYECYGLHMRCKRQSLKFWKGVNKAND